MTKPPNKSRLVLVYGGATTIEATGAMTVRRYRLARLAACQAEPATKSPAGCSNA